MSVHNPSAFRIAGFTSLLVLLAGCGDGKGQDGNEVAASSSGVGSEVVSEPIPAGPLEDCPLTAAEVSDVVGIAVQQDSMVCMFEPEPGRNPTVVYVRQVSFACSDSMVNDPEFDFVPFNGLGVRAYSSPTGGDLLVCTNPPFEITVDITPPLDAIVADSAVASAAARASEQAAAEQLVRLILGRLEAAGQKLV